MPNNNKYEMARLEARKWHVALREAPNEDKLADEFLSWLDADEDNELAWGELEWLHAHAQENALLYSTKVKTTKPPSQKMNSWRLPSVSIAAAVAAFLFIYVLGPDIYLRTVADYTTGKGETRQITLADGSIINLSADSAIITDINSNKRDIRLLRGAIFLDVHKDPKVPFSVSVGDVSAQAIGTQFEVWKTSLGATVSVAEGRVDVTSPTSKNKLRLEVGKQVRVRRSVLEIPKALQLQPGRVASWRHGKLVVRDWTVGDVLDVLVRHYKGRVIMLPNFNRQHVINGVFYLDDPLQAIRLVAGAHNLQVRQLAPWLVIVSGL